MELIVKQTKGINIMTTQTKRHNKLKPINPDTSCKFMILRNIAEQITYLEEDLTRTKQWVSNYWELSILGHDPMGAFQSLNYFKDIQRDIQKQLRNLRYIQKVVKLIPDPELTLQFVEKMKYVDSLVKQEKPKKLDSRKIN